jgi:hypothetical protein
MYFVSEIGLMLHSSLTLRGKDKIFQMFGTQLSKGQPVDSGFAGISISGLKGPCNEQEHIAYNAQGIYPFTSEG